VRRKIVNASPPPSLTGFRLNVVPSTFLDPFIKAETLQVPFVAVLFALALCHDLERTKPRVDLLERMSVALFGMVRIIMYFAPIDAFGAMAFTIGKYGMRTVFDLGQSGSSGLSGFDSLRDRGLGFGP
jgi:aerobic C4-dicarboxylate transport protein